MAIASLLLLVFSMVLAWNKNQAWPWFLVSGMLVIPPTVGLISLLVVCIILAGVGYFVYIHPPTRTKIEEDHNEEERK